MAESLWVKALFDTAIHSWRTSSIIEQLYDKLSLTCKDNDIRLNNKLIDLKYMLKNSLV
ncbi:hypothetical protein H4J58_04770 [Colwellia sp. MB3u-70]|uniref:hypothetical protein n=1 Tax=unclassified Colwellia TaxID=196834 RepID=UPI0015F68454|nr:MULTISPECIES: hypothetical protein [unclassified Colwellia]MBA6290883.1 hypothetical protein [Colwellia sp. MB3u-8]MBA6306428.1 hypothetical protein [Colwellia sp. MB3u-70]